MVKLDKFEQEELTEAIAKILCKRFSMHELKDLIKEKMYNKICSQIDESKLLEESIKSYKRSAGNRLATKADWEIYRHITRFSEELLKLENRIRKLEVKPNSSHD
jgi:hypothetical protein